VGSVSTRTVSPKCPDGPDMSPVSPAGHMIRLVLPVLILRRSPAIATFTWLILVTKSVAI
jgi:hypothetical protein